MSKAATVNAFVLTAHINEPEIHDVGDVVKGMPANQFADLEAVGLVREATKEEVTAADAKAKTEAGKAPVDA